MLLGHIDAQEIHLLPRFSVRSLGDRPAALNFLNQFQSDPAAMESLTDFLDEGSSNPAVAAGSPEDRFAGLIASGEALVGPGQRQLLWRHAVSSQSRSSALEFLRRFRTSSAAMGNLRQFVWKCSGSPDLSRVDDNRILEQAASWVASGEAVVGFRMLLHGGGGGGEEAPARPQPAAAAAAPRPSRDARELEPDPATFPPSHDAAMQAQALIAAAQTGVPFCLECEIARLQRSLAGTGAQ
jgi:hypothetical protein